MARHGADWYKREPQAYLGGVVGMTARQHAVFSVILDLIYAHGGSCPNDAKWICGWFSDLGAASVRYTISELIEIGKLRENRGQITNKRAKNQAKTREKLRENRSKTGEKGGKASGKSRARAKKNKDLSEPLGFPRAEQSREDKNRKEASLEEQIFLILGLGQRVPMTSRWSDLPEHITKWRTEFGLEDGEILEVFKTVLARRGVKPDGPAYFDGALHDHAMRKAGIKVAFKRMG